MISHIKIANVSGHNTIITETHHDISVVSMKMLLVVIFGELSKGTNYIIFFNRGMCSLC